MLSHARSHQRVVENCIEQIRDYLDGIPFSVRDAQPGRSPGCHEPLFEGQRPFLVDGSELGRPLQDGQGVDDLVQRLRSHRRWWHRLGPGHIRQGSRQIIARLRLALEDQETAGGVQKVSDNHGGRCY